jgi:hypothetical protein
MRKRGKKKGHTSDPTRLPKVSFADPTV